MRVSRATFEQQVTRALEAIPGGFRRFFENLIIEIEDRPDAATCDDLQLDDPRELLGLYRGTPLTDRSVESPDLPDRVTLYQRNIEAECDTEDELADEIRTTLLHEIGHFFGLDEQDLDDAGYA